MILDGIAGIKFLLQGDINHLYAVLKAHKDFYGNFKKMYNKRKENNIDKKYYENFIQAKKKGVKFLCYSSKVTDKEIILKNKIEIKF